MVVLVELTDREYEKYYLNISLVEAIYPRQGGTSEIYLTTGRSVICVESPEKIEKIIKDASERYVSS